MPAVYVVVRLIASNTGIQEGRAAIVTLGKSCRVKGSVYIDGRGFV